ncbi:hypothetical protein TNCV_4000911 [Trichonephila clavipes]|nr:hypothetical protein TNCV_4000911 [Trichonephila clavipes]
MHRVELCEFFHTPSLGHSLSIVAAEERWWLTRRDVFNEYDIWRMCWSGQHSNTHYAKLGQDTTVNIRCFDERSRLRSFEDRTSLNM